MFWRAQNDPCHLGYTYQNQHGFVVVKRKHSIAFMSPHFGFLPLICILRILTVMQPLSRHAATPAPSVYSMPRTDAISQFPVIPTRHFIKHIQYQF